MNAKKKKLIERIMIVCLVIIALELVGMLVIKIVNERKINRIEGLNDIVKVEDGYVGVGISDFHKSKFVKEKTYQYTNSKTKEKQNIIATQSRIVKYDDKMKTVWENTYKSDYDSTFYGILKVEDGYIAVGSFADELKQIENKTRKAVIVKYDNDGKQLWDNTYEVLDDTEFYKVIQDGDDYVVIGQSIYEEMVFGNHYIGGGIIVRYSKDGKELEHNNYGQPNSGTFNDIISVDDGFIVTGRDAGCGILVKFNKNFNREEDDTKAISKKVMWQRTYFYTDTKGFTSMALIDDKIYAVGAINISNEKDDNDKLILKYASGIITYNLNGRYVDKVVIEEESHHRFNSLLTDGKYLYLSMERDVDNDSVQKTNLVKYDIENKKVVKTYDFKKNNDFVINKLVDLNNKYYYVGTSNSSCGLLGCDYQDIYGYLEDLKDF